MSYLGRSLKNRFPLWSEVRMNESSNASMLLNAFGESINEERVSLLKSIDATTPLSGKALGEFGAFYSFSQPDIAAYKAYIRENSIFESVEATATIGNETITLDTRFDYSTLSLSYPTRVSSSFFKEENVKLFSLVNDDSILDATDRHFLYQKDTSDNRTFHKRLETFDFKNEYKKIYIHVSESKVFDTLDRVDNFNNHYSIVLRGHDETNRKVEEVIEIKDDGLYESKIFYKKICPLIEDNDIVGGGSIERYGFDGRLEILTSPVSIDSKKDTYTTIIKKSDDIGYNTLIENDIEYSLKKEMINNDEVSFLEYVFRSYEVGSDYKGEGLALSPDFFREVFSKRVILNSSLEPISIEDFCLDKVRAKIATIDKDFTLRYFSIDRENFTKKLINRTRQVDLGFETENQYVYLNEKSKMHLILNRSKGPIDYVIVGRHTPSLRLSYQEESNFNFEYLQEDMTWSSDFNYFLGDNRADIYENFDAIEWENEYTELGQYDFYTFSLRSVDFTTSRLDEIKTGAFDEALFKSEILKNITNPYQQKIHINSYSVLCEQAAPDYEIDLGKDFIKAEMLAKGYDLNNVNYSVSLWYENVENTLKFSININEKNFIFLTECFYDYMFFDYPSGSGATLESYDQLDLKINDFYESSISYTNINTNENVRKERNGTWLDEIGFKYGLTREINERLNSYRHRIMKCVKGTLNQEQDSFYKSLGYITSMEDEDIFSITKTNQDQNIQIEITCNRIRIWVDNVLSYENRFENLKYLNDFKQAIEGLNYLSIEVLSDNDGWMYKRTENLMPCNSSRQKMDLVVSSQSKILPEKNIKNINDFSGDFLRNVDEAQITNRYNYSLEDDVLHKYKKSSEEVTYEYEDFPFIITWMPIKACPVNDKDFTDLIKTTFKDNENYGDLSGNIENNYTEKLLSQSGSVIVNKILNKQNTYWGF